MSATLPDSGPLASIVRPALAARHEQFHKATVPMFHHRTCGADKLVSILTNSKLAACQSHSRADFEQKQLPFTIILYPGAQMSLSHSASRVRLFLAPNNEVVGFRRHFPDRTDIFQRRF